MSETFNVPIPYPAQEPIDSVDEVFALLRSLRCALIATSQKLVALDATDAAVILDEIMDRLDPIRSYLAENSFTDEELPYLECRRQWHLRKGVRHEPLHPPHRYERRRAYPVQLSSPRDHQPMRKRGVGHPERRAG